jgi:transposase InsO family protein
MSLEDIYRKYNYPGQAKLYQLAKKDGVKTTVNEVKQFISKQKVSQVFKPSPKKRGFIVAFHPKERVQMDLIDMTNYSRQNNGYGWILLIVDVFTRFVWAYVMPRKDVASVDATLSQFITKYHPDIVMSDNETSFKSKIVQELMKENDVEHTMVDAGDHKALGVIDRAVKTIKDSIFKYMTDKNKSRYIDQLPRIISAYNDTPNGGILDIAPADAETKENTTALQIENHKKELVNKKNRTVFHVGDHVRIRNRKATFERSYDEKYGEQFIIEKIEGTKVVLDNGETISKRRIVKVAPILAERESERVPTLRERESEPKASKEPAKNAVKEAQKESRLKKKLKGLETWF